MLAGARGYYRWYDWRTGRAWRDQYRDHPRFGDDLVWQ